MAAHPIWPRARAYVPLYTRIGLILVRRKFDRMSLGVIILTAASLLFGLFLRRHSFNHAIVELGRCNRGMGQRRRLNCSNPDPLNA